jgi:hypothetical protein
MCSMAGADMAARASGSNGSSALGNYVVRDEIASVLKRQERGTMGGLRDGLVYLSHVGTLGHVERGV